MCFCSKEGSFFLSIKERLGEYCNEIAIILKGFLRRSSEWYLEIIRFFRGDCNIITDSIFDYL